MKGRSGEREREKITLHQQTPMTLGLYSGVFLCLFLCPPSSPVVSCPNAAVWGMALLYVIACPRVPMGSWSLERQGDREMQGGCPGWWVMLQRRAGPSRMGDARGPSHGWTSTCALPWLQSQVSFLPCPSGHLGVLTFTCAPGELLTAGKMPSEREWLTVDHGNSKHLYSNNYKEDTQQEEKRGEMSKRLPT